MVACYYGATLQFSELLKTTPSFTNACKGALPSQVLGFMHMWQWD